MTLTHMDVSAAAAARPTTRRNWSRVVLAGVLGLALAVPAVAGSVAGLGVSAAEAERALREHVVHTLDGKPLTLGSLQGEVVVVNFWASWCAPCRRELPRLGGLQTELAPSGSRIVAISIDQDIENARRFCRAQSVAVTVAHDGPKGLARALDLKRVPLTLVLDRNGHIVYTTSRSDAQGLAAVATQVRQSSAQATPAAADADAGSGR